MQYKRNFNGLCHYIWNGKVIRIVSIRSRWSKVFKMCTFLRFVNRRDILHTSLSTHRPRSLITPLSPQVPHFHRNSPLSHHTTHSPILLLFTTQHTLHSLTTHSLLSHHTILTLSPHQSLSTHSRLSLQTPTFSFLPHHTLSLFSRRTTHLQLSHQNTLSPLTPTIILHHTLQTLSPHHTLPILSPHTLHSLTSHSPLSHHTFSTFSPHTPHYRTTLSSHSLLSHPTTPSRLFHHTPQFLTSLPTFVSVSFRISLPTLSPHSPLFYFTSYSYKSQISFPTLEPHFATAHSHFHYALHSFTTLPHFSLYSSLSSHPQFLTLDFLISLLILSHHHPCPQGGH